MKPSRIALSIGLLGIGSAALATPAMVSPFHSTYGTAKYKVLGKASCTICHVGKTAKLNPYGADLKKALAAEKTKTLTGSVLKRVEGLDSDKDGNKNIDEIRADTLPGDAKSLK